MATMLDLPHHVRESTCYVNGLFDVLAWKGAAYDYSLLPIVGGMCGFAFLKFKMASPPCMVYWGNSPRYLLEELSQLIGFSQTISEGKSFKNEFPRIKKLLECGRPVMVGALDMYYLHYYPDLFKKEHVPLHYVLVVGYDDEKKVVHVHDCSWPGVRQVPYDDFESSLNVNVPGLSKRNTSRVFEMPASFISELELAEKGLARKAGRMLSPPVALLGVPAMRKLATDIVNWTDPECFKHLAAYAGLTPPLVAEDLSHNDGMRFEQARLLGELGLKYGRPVWAGAAGKFAESGKLITRLCSEAVRRDGQACSRTLGEIAAVEEEGYKILLPPAARARQPSSV